MTHENTLNADLRIGEIKTGELWRNRMNGGLVEVVEVEPHCVCYVWIHHPEHVQSRPLSMFNADFELEETAHVA